MTYRGVEGEWKHVLHAVKRDVIWSVLRSLAQLANPVSQLPPTPTPHTRPSPLTLSSPSPRGNLLAYACTAALTHPCGRLVIVHATLASCGEANGGGRRLCVRRDACSEGAVSRRWWRWQRWRWWWGGGAQ